MRRLPSGTLTLLFTDIAGSTRLVEELGDRYADVLAEHRRRLRAVFELHRGVEVDTQGDAFFVVFPEASEALAAAVDAREALADGGPVRVRIGIHTGEPTRTEDGYVGLDVHRAARIAAAGHGGQILLSESTRQLVDRRHLRDLGAHRLKDVGEVRLYQVGDDEFPPLESLSRSSLPQAPTPLLGRKRELADLLRLLRVERTRLVTVVGPGGIGKTRLALEAATELVSSFDDGASFVDLSAVRDPELVEPAIVSALGAGGALRDYVRERELLLVLDNLEQVVGVAPDLGDLLETCPQLAILGTSREPLRLRAELEYPLRPLAEAPAVELFLERAHTMQPGFDAEYGQLVELCDRLDRIPLAIELAAARVKVLSAEELLTRLDRRLPLLTSGARDAPERQRTLQATIAWSYDLLGEDERRLFSALAVFAGGWTLEAAEQVCAADLDTLQSLVDKNLVRAEHGRFRMLETISEYALERFEELEDVERLRADHADYFTALALRAEPELTGAEQHVWLERLDLDYENIRATFDWLESAPGDGSDRALRLASALVLFWFNRSRFREGLHRLERVLEATEGDETAARAGALWGAGLLWTLVGDAALAAPLLEQSLALARSLEDGSIVARALSVLGLLAFFENNISSARELFEESVVVARRANDTWILADGLGTLGSIYPLQGDFDRAEAVGAEAREIGLRFGDRQGIRMANFGLALTAARRGELEVARSLGEEGLAICREIGDLWFVSYFLWILATVATDSGDQAVARAFAEESLKIAREIEGPLLVVCALDALAAVARVEGDDQSARGHLAEAAELGRSAIVPDSYLASVLRASGEVALAHGDPAEAELHLDESLERARDVDDPWMVGRVTSSRAALAAARGDRGSASASTREALALQVRIGDQLGALETLERLAALVVDDDPEAAGRIIGLVERQRQRLGASRPQWESRHHERVVHDIRRALSDAGYEAAVRDGAALTLEDAVALVSP